MAAARSPLVLAALGGATAVCLLIWHRRRCFELFLAAEAQAVRETAKQQAVQPKPEAAGLASGLPEPVQRFFDRSMRVQGRSYRCVAAAAPR